jgi:hypothetical protein
MVTLTGVVYMTANVPNVAHSKFMPGFLAHGVTVPNDNNFAASKLPYDELFGVDFIKGAGVQIPKAASGEEVLQVLIIYHTDTLVLSFSKVFEILHWVFLQIIKSVFPTDSKICAPPPIPGFYGKADFNTNQLVLLRKARDVSNPGSINLEITPFLFPQLVPSCEVLNSKMYFIFLFYYSQYVPYLYFELRN